MSTPQAPLTPEQRLAAEQQAQYARMKRNVAIGGLIVCPLIAILPPRKLDLYTFSLGVGFYLSADHLCEVRTGRGLLLQLGPKPKPISGQTMEKAQDIQRVLKEEREKSRKTLERPEPEPEPEPEKKGILGIVEKLWMGSEKEGWKERRMEEERKAFEEGKSYTDIIIEQISDVINWDKKSENSGQGGKDGGRKE